MTMSPQLRQFALTAHVTVSLGWTGAVVCFLALAVAGFTSQNPQIVQAAYLAMNLICWSVILPLSLASPATGIVQSLGTAWGLFRHYWVLVKFLVTIPCTLILIVHMLPTSKLAAAAAQGTLDGRAMGGLRMQLIGDSAAAVFVLLVLTALSMYKPRGLTAFGAARANTNAARSAGKPVWISVLRGTVIVLGAAFCGGPLDQQRDGWPWPALTLVSQSSASEADDEMLSFIKR